MNKTLLLIIPIIVLLGIGGILLLKSIQKADGLSTTPLVTNTPSQIVTKDTEIPGGMPKSSYIDFSSTSFEETKGNKQLLFFYANWCPTCRPVDAEIQRRANEIPSNMVIIKVNYDDTDTDSEEDALAKKYNVTYQHTFVLIDQDGNEIKKWNGDGFDKILSEI